MMLITGISVGCRHEGWVLAPNCVSYTRALSETAQYKNGSLEETSTSLSFMYSRMKYQTNAKHNGGSQKNAHYRIKMEAQVTNEISCGKTIAPQPAFKRES